MSATDHLAAGVDHLVAHVDHLVVMAASLAEGVAWCEATLGVTPGPGGEHPLMGTHNRLLRIASPAFPQAYLELIAIDPDAPALGRVRWFGLDDPALQARLQALYAADGDRQAMLVETIQGMRTVKDRKSVV